MSVYIERAKGYLIASIAAISLCNLATAEENAPIQVASAATIETADHKKITIDEAQKRLQTTYSRLTFTDFREGPIPGLFEIVAGNRVIYYQPQMEILIFGELFSKDGRSLTQEYLTSQQEKKIATIPLDQALVIGNGPKKIIEFTDPDCPYCQRLHAFLKDHAKEVTRYVFFSPIRGLHPDSPQKVVHILCSKDKAASMDAVYSGKVAPTELTKCEEGEKLEAKQEAISTQFGVGGTPMLVLDNSVVTGFQEARIAQFINPNSATQSK